jgi:hypothetical protein
MSKLSRLHKQLIYANEKLSEMVAIDDIKYSEGLSMLKCALKLIEEMEGEK